jgi:hypothetical protein
MNDLKRLGMIRDDHNMAGMIMNDEGWLRMITIWIQNNGVIWFEKWLYGIAYSITYKNNYVCTNILILVFNLFIPRWLGMIRDDHNMAGMITND